VLPGRPALGLVAVELLRDQPPLEAFAEAQTRGSMFVQGGQFDRSSIPSDPVHRVLRVPIPADADGRPAYDRRLLWPHERIRLKAEHDAKVSANLRERDTMLTLCHGDAAARRDDQVLCSRDPRYWIERWVWVIDPRLGEKATVDPFVLYESQAEEVRWFLEDFLTRDEILALIEKSRAYGATWLWAVALPTWGFLYRQNWSVLIGAANEKDVDAGGIAADHQSIFGKIRFLLNNLPPWQVPPGLLTDPAINKNLQIRHPENTNVLRGRHFCSNWGRSQRYLFTVADEAAHSLNYRAAAANYGNTSDRNIAMSTHLGAATAFAQMVVAAKEERTHDRVVKTRIWAENPNLTTDTYWGWREKYGWEAVASERDIDIFGSVGFAIFQDFDPSISVVTPVAEVRDETGKVLVEARAALDYREDLPLGLLVDPGTGPDPFAILWVQPDDEQRTLNIVDFCQHVGRPGPFFVPFITGFVPEVTLDRKPWSRLYEYDAIDREMIERHARWRPLDGALCFGDTYGDSKATSSASGLSLYRTWAEYGVPLVRPVKIKNKEDAVQRVNSAIGRVRIAARLLHQRTQNRQTPTIVECLKSYSWVNRESPDGLPLPRVPKHDKFCHACDALQFWFQFHDADDPTIVPGAPFALRRPQDAGRAGFFRSAAPPSSEYPVDDDPITRG
jgi:hypothetical protein